MTANTEKLTDDFVKGMTEAELDVAEKIEAEVGALLTQGLSEKVAMAFVLAVPVIRKRVPGATVEGILESVMLSGVGAVLNSVGVKKAKPKRGIRGV